MIVDLQGVPLNAAPSSMRNLANGTNVKRKTVQKMAFPTGDRTHDPRIDQVKPGQLPGIFSEMSLKILMRFPLVFRTNKYK